jgi:hypothetical protein
MLECAGYQCVLPDRKLRDYLRDKIGCRNVDEPKDMQLRWGAELPPKEIREVGIDCLDRCDLYVDVNGGYNGPRLWEKHPRLKGKILTYFINGGEPRITWDKGNNVDGAIPIATTAQHFRADLWCYGPHPNVEGFSCDNPPNPRGYWQNTKLVSPTVTQKVNNIYPDGTLGHSLEYHCPWGCGPLKPAPWKVDNRTYVFWPSFSHWDRVKVRATGNGSDPYTDPVSLVHNCLTWGCQAFVEPARNMGVKAYGGGSSPDGLVKHEDVFDMYRSSLCTVYLKGGGAVDYSILEPMACGCPTTFHTSYVHNCRLYGLLEDGITCLMWDSESSLRDCIERLKDPRENRYIGFNGKQRMAELVWNKDNGRDVKEFTEWMGKMFP